MPSRFVPAMHVWCTTPICWSTRSGTAARYEVKSGSGFGGMDLDLSRSPLDPVSHFLSWKPGTRPYEEPSGFAWRLNPGNLLVLNTHLQPTGKAEEGCSGRGPVLHRGEAALLSSHHAIGE